jgi:hypothetical protein
VKAAKHFEGKGIIQCRCDIQSGEGLVEESAEICIYRAPMVIMEGEDIFRREALMDRRRDMYHDLSNLYILSD